MNKIINVVAAVIIKGNKILCTQRGNTKYLAYKWEFPDGKVDPDEQLEDALIREIQEELGCSISIIKYLLTTKHHYDFGTVKINAFLCQLIDNDPVCLEHNKICWLDSNELNDLDWAQADLPIVYFLTK